MAEVNSSGGGRKKGGKVRSKKASTKVDMTPMVDLAFLLITFFMLTTTFNKPQTMEVNMPDQNDKQEKTAYKESETMTLVLGKENKVYYYMGLTNPEVSLTDYSDEGIRKVLQEKNREIPEFKVIIKAMEKSRYKNMVDILDEMHITNIKFYAIGKISPQDIELTEKHI